MVVEDPGYRWQAYLSVHRLLHLRAAIPPFSMFLSLVPVLPLSYRRIYTDEVSRVDPFGREHSPKHTSPIPHSRLPCSAKSKTSPSFRGPAYNPMPRPKSSCPLLKSPPFHTQIRVVLVRRDRRSHRQGVESGLAPLRDQRDYALREESQGVARRQDRSDAAK